MPNETYSIKNGIGPAAVSTSQKPDFSIIKDTIQLIQCNDQKLKGRKQLQSKQQSTNSLLPLLINVWKQREHINFYLSGNWNRLPSTISKKTSKRHVIKRIVRLSRRHLEAIGLMLTTKFATLPNHIIETVSQSAMSLADTLVFGVAGHPKNQIRLMKILLRSDQFSDIESFRRSLTDLPSRRSKRSGLVRKCLHLFVVSHGKKFVSYALEDLIRSVIAESKTDLALESEFMETNLPLVQWTTIFLDAICSALMKYPIPKPIKEGVIKQLLKCQCEDGSKTNGLAVEWVLCHWLLQVILTPDIFLLNLPEKKSLSAAENLRAIGSYLMKIFQAFILERDPNTATIPTQRIGLLDRYRSKLEASCKIFCSSVRCYDSDVVIHNFPLVAPVLDLSILQNILWHMGFDLGSRAIKERSTREIVALACVNGGYNEDLILNRVDEHAKDQYRECAALKTVLRFSADTLLGLHSQQDSEIRSILESLLEWPLKDDDRIHLEQFLSQCRQNVAFTLKILHEEQLRISGNLTETVNFPFEVELACQTKAYREYLLSSIQYLESQIQNIQIAEIAERVLLNDLNPNAYADAYEECKGSAQLSKDIFVCRKCSRRINKKRNMIVSFLNSTAIRGFETEYPNFPKLDYHDRHVNDALLDMCISGLSYSDIWISCELEDNAFVFTTRKLTSFFKTYESFFNYCFPKAKARKDLDEGIVDLVVEELEKAFSYKSLVKRLECLKRCRDWLMRSFAFHPQSTSDDYLPMLTWCLCRTSVSNICSGMHMMRVLTQRKNQEQWFADLSVAIRALLSLTLPTMKEESMDSRSSASIE